MITRKNKPIKQKPSPKYFYHLIFNKISTQSKLEYFIQKQIIIGDGVVKFTLIFSQWQGTVFDTYRTVSLQVAPHEN